MEPLLFNFQPLSYAMSVSHGLLKDATPVTCTCTCQKGVPQKAVKKAANPKKTSIPPNSLIGRFTAVMAGNGRFVVLGAAFPELAELFPELAELFPELAELFPGRVGRVVPRVGRVVPRVG